MSEDSDMTGGPSGRDWNRLIEQVASSWRPRDRDGRIEPHPAWHDLGEDDRLLAYEATVQWRQIEAALDPRGLSGTGRAVMRRIEGRQGL